MGDVKLGDDGLIRVFPMSRIDPGDDRFSIIWWPSRDDTCTECDTQLPDFNTIVDRATLAKLRDAIDEALAADSA